jgi:hypothetical protein
VDKARGVAEIDGLSSIRVIPRSGKFSIYDKYRKEERKI